MKKLYPKLYRQLLKWHDLIDEKEHVLQVITDSRNFSPVQLKILESLGENFPMSYKQAYVFYKDIFLQVDVHAQYEALDTINILVLNSRFGADILGLIQAFNECFDKKRLVIYSVEKEEEVLAFQQSMIKDWMKPRFKRHDIQVVPLLFDLKRAFQSLGPFLIEQQAPKAFDLIHSFYVLSEDALFKPTILPQYFSFIKTHLSSNKLALIVEQCESEARPDLKPSVAYHLLNGWIHTFKRQDPKEKLYALTPVPCVSRAMTERWHTQCANCSSCGVLIETTGAHDNFSEKVFAMHLTTTELYQKLKSSLFNNQATYLTKTNDRYNVSQCCALNAERKSKDAKKMSAFFLSQPSEEKEK